ncbi:hypothetical protein ACKVMT_10530 [Halobacteriales archaeon Cl-PHB]
MASHSTQSDDAPGASHDEGAVVLERATDGDTAPDQVADLTPADRVQQLVLAARVQELEAQLDRTKRRLEAAERELDRKERRIQTVTRRYEEVLEGRDEPGDVCFSFFGTR